MFVFSNLAISIDGKIATTSREHFPLGTPEDRKQMQVLRKEANLVLFGASTLRAYRKYCGVQGAPKGKQPWNAVMSSQLDGISLDWPIFKEAGGKLILFCGPKTPSARIKRFEKKTKVIVLKKSTPKNPTAVQIIAHLKGLGIQRLLVEGGGAVMWDFASQDLIDEYHVTLTPRIVGGTEAPTLVDGPGFDPKSVLNLKLEQSRVLGDEIYLIYRKSGKRG